MQKLNCLHCEDEFEQNIKEAIDFMRSRADLLYLRRKFEKLETACESFKIPYDSFNYFDNIEQIIFAFIVSHCPYCREVNLSKSDYSPGFPKDALTDEEYLKVLEKEIRGRNGFQIKKIQ